MSRALRVHREAQALSLQRKILKTAGAQGQGNGIIRSELSDADAEYSSRLALLESFKTKSKVSTKAQSHKSEWLKEQCALAKVAGSTEEDLLSLLEILVLHNPSDPDIYAFVQEHTQQTSSRRRSQKLIVDQLRDVKSLLHDLNKNNNNNNKQKDGNKGNSKNNDSSSNRVVDRLMQVEGGAFGPAVSIFADMLVRLRSSHGVQWTALAAEESTLLAQVTHDKRSIANMLMDERVQHQNEQLHRDLQLEQGDDEDVALLMDEWFAKLNTLDAAHTATLLALKTGKEARKASIGGGLRERGEPAQEQVEGGEVEEDQDTVQSRNSAAAVWSEEDHNKFVKVFRHASSTGLSRKAMLELVHAQLPHQSRDAISNHEAHYRAHRALQSKKKDIEAAYLQTREELLVQAREELGARRAARKEEREREARQLEHERARAALHDHLDALRAARAALDARMEVERQEALAKEEEEEKRLASIARAEAEWKRTQVEVFQLHKARLAQARQEEKERADEALRQALHQEVEANREKVARRENLRLLKEEEKRKREAAAEEEEAQRVELLHQLAAQVPYWENIQNAKSQLDHVTAAVKAQEYVRGEEETRGHFRATGFADKKIVSDARLRLAFALREAGLHHSEAARSAVASFHPRPHLAIHGILH